MIFLNKRGTIGSTDGVGGINCWLVSTYGVG